MTVKSSSGTCLSISAALPATHDADGFTALAFTQVGELETLGDVVLNKQTGSFTRLCSGDTTVIKGGEEATTIAPVVGLDRDDGGQTIVAAAYESPNDYAFRITESDGDAVYFVGKVTSWGFRYGTGTEAVRTPITIGLTAAPSDTDANDVRLYKTLVVVPKA